MKITKQLAKILLDEIDENKTHENFKCVHDGAWEDDGKYDLREKIFQDTNTNKFYGLYDSRSGSYYTDYWYESDDWKDEVQLQEVEAKQKTITEWKAVK